MVTKIFFAPGQYGFRVTNAEDLRRTTETFLAHWCKGTYKDCLIFSWRKVIIPARRE